MTPSTDKVPDEIDMLIQRAEKIDHLLNEAEAWLTGAAKDADMGSEDVQTRATIGIAYATLALARIEATR